MGELFNLDNKFFAGLGKIIDCVVLSMIWLIFCIPVFTAGAATTALYYTINKVIRHGRGYMWGEFWHGFKTNFKQSTIAWLIMLVMGIFLGIDTYIMYQFAQAGEKMGAIYPVFPVFMMLLLVWGIYLFPYIARFENSTKLVIKNAGLIAIANLPWTVLLFLVLCVTALLAWLFFPLILVLPAAYMLIANVILEKIFRKYMSEEDIAAEEERNTEYYY